MVLVAGVIRDYHTVRDAFYTFVEKHVDGGTTEYPMDAFWLEEQEVITADEFYEYESQLCNTFDSWWFQCCGCGWTLPVSEMGEDRNTELCCIQCNEEDE